MITLRRAEERRHERRRRQDVWQTFGRTFEPDDREGARADGFGALEGFAEERIPPGMVVPRRGTHAGEVLTYVREGALAHEDSRGRSGVLCAGEFQCRTISPGLRCRETNASATDWAQVFEARLRAPAANGLAPAANEPAPACAQKRFSVADRRGQLCLVASLGARGGSLRLEQDARIFSAVLSRGLHVVHELAPGRSAWVHVVAGAATIGEFVLTTGDGAGVTGERAVSLTAREPSEILLIDVGGVEMA